MNSIKFSERGDRIKVVGWLAGWLRLNWRPLSYMSVLLLLCERVCGALHTYIANECGMTFLMWLVYLRSTIARNGLPDFIIHTMIVIN